MTIEEMKDKKKEKGYSYEQMADLSGIPLGTIQKIFSGETKSPRYDTLIALEQLFTEPLEVRETASCYNADRNGSYTLDDYYALPEYTVARRSYNGRYGQYEDSVCRRSAGCIAEK